MLCFRSKSVVLILIFFVFACSKDDGYTPISINAAADTAEVFQDDTVSIPLFSNDTDLPSAATVSFDDPQGGTITLRDSNATPNNPFDDVLEYQSNRSFEGIDSFNYTICDPGDAANCSTAVITVTVKPRSFVNFDLQNMPFAKLSEYNFFQGNLKELTPSYKVIPYDLNSALFSDYAKKKRFVWLPEDTEATLVDDFSVLNFPVGSILIKNFYYQNVAGGNSTQLIETRLMYLTDNGWQFAEYVWNDEQTDAIFDDSGSFKTVEWMENGVSKTVNYRIPSKTECISCHNSQGQALPIGPKPQNLDKMVDVGQGVQNQISYLMSEGIIENSPLPAINATVDWQDDSQPMDLRVRSYLDINCAHCHSDQSFCDYRPVRFAFSENGQAENIGICVEPDDPILPYGDIVTPGEADKSLLLFRLKSTEEQYRMPLLGRSLQHEEGVALIEAWIDGLEQNCE